jgi:hypothetical protein
VSGVRIDPSPPPPPGSAASDSAASDPGIPDTAPTPPPAGQHAPTPAQGGPLLVTRVGSTRVATDGMQAHLEQLRDLGEHLAATTRALVIAEGTGAWSTEPGAPVSARRSAADIAAAIHAGRGAHRTTTQLVRALRHAIAAYDDAETRALAAGDRWAAVGGAGLGLLVRLGLPAIGVLGLGVWLESKLPDPGGLRSSGMKRFFLDHPGLITGTGFVEGVRMFTAGLDEGTSAFLGLPIPVAVLLGASGVTGIRSSARGLLAVGPLVGLFRETPVRVERVATSMAAAAPVGAVQRLERVPEVNQVRVEKYDAPGQPSRFVVYVGPTETFSPVADHEPWDLTSNVGGVGGLDVGAFRASEIAMRDAGVTSSSQVQFVGFSQGGLIASMLAASGDWNAAGIQTFGAPAGNIEMPTGLSGMAVRNTDDFIPMLAGPQLDHHVLQVERQAFADGQTLPDYHAAPAHQRDAYMATAAVVDDATSAAVRQQSQALDAFTGEYAAQHGSAITVTSYHAERVPGPTPKLDLKQLELRQPAQSHPEQRHAGGGG